MAFYASMLLCNLRDGLNQPWVFCEVPQKQRGESGVGGTGLRDSHMDGERGCLTVLFLNFPK